MTTTDLRQAEEPEEPRCLNCGDGLTNGLVFCSDWCRLEYANDLLLQLRPHWLVLHDRLRQLRQEHCN